MSKLHAFKDATLNSDEQEITQGGFFNFSGWGTKTSKDTKTTEVTKTTGTYTWNWSFNWNHSNNGSWWCHDQNTNGSKQVTVTGSKKGTNGSIKATATTKTV